MKLNELKELVDTYVNDGLENRNIVIDLNEHSIGGRVSTGLVNIYPGFDWESGQIRVQTADKICRLGNSKNNSMKMQIFAHISSRKYYGCPSCGEFVRKTDRWCSHCGQRIVYDPNQKPIDE